MTTPLTEERLAEIDLRHRVDGHTPFSTFYEIEDLLAEVKRLRATPANQPNGEWQPIDTAPKDGTSVLVYVPQKELPLRNAPSSRWKTFAQRVIEARWIVPPPDDKHVTISPFGRHLEAKYGGYWTTDPRCIAALRGMPTHWIPLPAHPQSKEGPDA